MRSVDAKTLMDLAAKVPIEKGYTPELFGPVGTRNTFNSFKKTFLRTEKINGNKTFQEGTKFWSLIDLMKKIWSPILNQ